MAITLATFPVLTKTANVTLTVADAMVFANGTFTVTMFPVATNIGRAVTVKNIGNGTITVKGNASENIDGLNSYQLDSLHAATFVVDATQWRVVGMVFDDIGFALTANNATYAFGKTEGALNVNSASTALTANNSTYHNGKLEANLNVNNATTAATANNSTYLNGQAASFYTNASNLGSGTIPDARFGATVVLQGISANGVLRLDTTNGRIVLPVGTNKWA